MLGGNQVYRGRPEQRSSVPGAAPRVVFSPRDGHFDSELVEPGPQPILLPGDGNNNGNENGDGTGAGGHIVMIYNSKNKWCMDHPDGLCRRGENDPRLPPGTYSAGQVLLSAVEPMRVVARLEQPFMQPERPWELSGQVGNVVSGWGSEESEWGWLGHSSSLIDLRSRGLLLYFTIIVIITITIIIITRLID